MFYEKPLIPLDGSLLHTAARLDQRKYRPYEETLIKVILVEIGYLRDHCVTNVRMRD